MNQQFSIPFGLAMALLATAPEPGPAQVLQRRGSIAFGAELAGVGTRPERRGLGLAIQFARDTPLGRHGGWWLGGIYSMTTANPPSGRTWGSYALIGTAIGPHFGSRGPYVRLGGGLMQSQIGEPDKVSHSFTGMAGYGVAGLDVAGRMFVQVSMIAPTTGNYGRPYVAMLVGRWNRHRVQ